jgi:hypothetical protein
MTFMNQNAFDLEGQMLSWWKIMQIEPVAREQWIRAFEEANFERRPRCMFGHPLFRGDRFVFDYP